MPEFEEWSKKEGESKENGIEQISEKGQVRYALKRGRIPQVRNFTENGEAVAASIVDVEHDAIGARSRGGNVSDVSPIKKSTEIVEEAHVFLDKRPNSHLKAIRRKDEQKSKSKGGKIPTYSKVVKKHPIRGFQRKLLGFWKKILKIFCIKSKDFKSSNDEVLSQHGKKDKQFSRSRYQNSFSKKVK
jgi:hypothetical protein